MQRHMDRYQWMDDWFRRHRAPPPLVEGCITWNWGPVCVPTMQDCYVIGGEWALTDDPSPCMHPHATSTQIP